MHYFKRNIGDYHKKAGRLSMLEHGAYTLLIDSCYDRERFPTMDEAIDWCWARTDEEVAAVRFVLSKFFELIDGRYVQARIQEEINAYHAKSAKNKEIAEEREANRRKAREQSCTKRAPDVNEAPPNQEPITNNQEPVEKNTPPTPRKRGAVKVQLNKVSSDDLQALGVDQQVADEFLALRQRKRATLTDVALAGIRREADGIGWTLEQALRKCIERGWQGFEAGWVQQSAGRPGQPQLNRQEALELRNREIALKWAAEHTE